MNDDDDSEFARLVGPVRRIEHDRIEPRPNRPPPRVRRRPDAERPPTEERGIADVPEQTAAEWFHHGLQKKLRQRIQRGQLPIDARLDLHGLRRDEAIAALGSFLDEGLQLGCRLLLVVHGQGYGSSSAAVLKPLTRHWLSQQPEVLAWCPAQPRDGGGGASYVYLRTRAASSSG